MSDPEATLHDPSSGAAPTGRMLLLDGDKPNVRSIARVARAAMQNVDVCHSLAEASDEVSYDLLVVNCDALAAGDLDKLLDRFASLRDRGRLLVYSRNSRGPNLEAWFSRRGLTNLLALDSDLESDELLVTIQKIIRRDIFGIDKYFPWGSQMTRRTLRGSADIAGALAEVEAFVAVLGVQPRLADLFYTVADELTSNALYNAPVDHEGRARFAHLARTEAITLPSHDEVHMTLCSDGRKVGISVTDPFGSLSASTVRDYLAKCFRRGPDQVDQKAGGAGLGLYCTFEAVSHFVITVSPRRRTEMIGLIDVRGGFKDFAARGKSFNIFLES